MNEKTETELKNIPHWAIFNGKIFVDGEYVGDIPKIFPAPSRWVRFRRRLARMIEGQA